jgi:hypothetical protein
MESSNKDENTISKHLIRLMVDLKETSKKFKYNNTTKLDFINYLKTKFKDNSKGIENIFSNDKTNCYFFRKRNNYPYQNILKIINESYKINKKNLQKKKSINSNSNLNNKINQNKYLSIYSKGKEKQKFLDSKKIKKNELIKLLFSLEKKVNNKKNKKKEIDEIIEFKEERKNFIKTIKLKIENLTLEQIKQISEKFFSDKNNNENEICLELNKLNDDVLKKLLTYVNNLEHENLQNKNFISYKDEIRKIELNDKKNNDLHNFKSIFDQESNSNIFSDSDSDSSDLSLEK